MGLITGAKRLHYRWSWRARYWWLDTSEGASARVTAFGLALLVVVLQLIRVSVASALPPPPGEPVKAFYWWVVQIIVALIAAAVAYYARPKIEAPAPREGQAPTTEDGQSAKRHWGTHWIGDEFLLAWKVVGRDPIKGDGGK